MTASGERLAPRVSIGLPVFNGERYLGEAIDSLLAQTFTDFELIIGDNASTDRTEQICRRAAAHDARVRYVRHPENLGAARNYNEVFRLSSGEYFRWATYDDLWHPDHLARSVEALDADPGVVLSFTGALDIDEDGRVLRRRDERRDLESPDPAVRFQAARGGHPLPFFGLVRADVLRRTHLHEHYTGCDRVLLGELALTGRFREVPGDLFLHREHASQARHAARNRRQRLVWYDTSRSGRWYFPEWLYLLGFVRAIVQAPVDRRSKVRCLRTVWRHARKRARLLVIDLAGGLRDQARNRGRTRETHRDPVAA